MRMCFLYGMSAYFRVLAKHLVIFTVYAPVKTLQGAALMNDVNWKCVTVSS